MLGIDTIPKPDGLGQWVKVPHVEQSSIDFEPCPKKIECCSPSFESRSVNGRYCEVHEPIGAI